MVVTADQIRAEHARAETHDPGRWITWDEATRQHWVPPRWNHIPKTHCGLNKGNDALGNRLRVGGDQRRCTVCALGELAESAEHASQAALAKVIEDVPGVTYRQLYNWIKLGYVRPDNPACGSGHTMRFPPAELAVARRIGRLLHAGLALEPAARVARAGQGAEGRYTHYLDVGISVTVQPLVMPGVGTPAAP